MKEMKVIRKRRRRHKGSSNFTGAISGKSYQRRYHSTNFLAKAIIICVVLTVVTAGALCLKIFVFDKADKEPVVPPSVIENNKSISLIMNTGDRTVLSVYADEAAINKLEFESNAPEVVTVDSGGRVDCKKEGKATISVSCEGYYGECVITVEKGSKTLVQSDEVTSAYIKNLDVVEKNKENTSKNLYRVTVNRRTNTVTVYTYDKKGNYTVPVRAMVCSCGENNEENRTITGVFSVYFKNRWHGLFGDVYGQYVTGFSGDYLFHSVPYLKTQENSLKTEEFNKLSTNASQGCVRMMIADTKWIYDNLDIGTVVEVIDAPAQKDPLGTPPTVKIDKKWDPTDPHKDNPYRNIEPKIKGAEDVTIKKGESYNPKVTATDSCAMDATKQMEIIGNVNTNKKGTYYVTYSLTDVLKKHTEVTVKVIVE